MKHLIVCCDGTWNSPQDKTNVCRLHDVLADRNADGEQKKHYVEGIGTSDFVPAKVVGGAAGLGLGSRMVEAYDWLARRYQYENSDGPDKISLFGFSRGAYIARNLAGLLTSYGLVPVPPNTDEGDRTLAKEVYSAYHHNQDRGSVWRRWWAQREFAHPVEVFFLGVWDTVGSLGIPAEFGILDKFDASRYRFYNTRLSDLVIHARHAVALDERRGPFAPTLWATREDANGLTFRQVWFPGNHGTVGGITHERGAADGLSDVTLQWMVDQAKGCGIAFDQDRFKPNPYGRFKENVRSFYRVLNPHPRAVPRIPLGDRESSAEVHESATERVRGLPGYRRQTTLTGDDTLQATVSVAADQQWNDTGIWLTPGRYRLRATGEWSDSGVKSGPSGESTSGARVAALARKGVKVLELLQSGVRMVTRNDQARVFGTTRVTTDSDGEHVPRMCLVGVIADGELDPNTELQRTHTTFKIGDFAEFEVFRAGYLYAFANDAWGSYSNNAGAVDLTVQSCAAPARTRPPATPPRRRGGDRAKPQRQKR